MPKLQISAVMEIDAELHTYLGSRYPLIEVRPGVIKIESMDFLFMLRELLTSHIRQEAVASDLAQAVKTMTASIDVLAQTLANAQTPAVVKDKVDEAPTPPRTNSEVAARLAALSGPVPPEPEKPVLSTGPVEITENSDPVGPRKIDPALMTRRVKKLMGGN